MPNALDLLVVCVESGLGLDQAILQVPKNWITRIRRSAKSSALVNLELKAGKRATEALRNLAERTNVDELKKLVAVLIQADRFGTGIAQSLRGHADFMRVQSRQVAEEKAAKLGVKLVFPIFFCILPSLFVVTVGPVAMKIVAGTVPDDAEHLALAGDLSDGITHKFSPAGDAIGGIGPHSGRNESCDEISRCLKGGEQWIWFVLFARCSRWLYSDSSCSAERKAPNNSQL